MSLAVSSCPDSSNQLLAVGWRALQPIQKDGNLSHLATRQMAGYIYHTLQVKLQPLSRDNHRYIQKLEWKRTYKETPSTIDANQVLLVLLK